MTDEDDVQLLKAVRYPREVKKPNTEPAEKPREKAIKAVKPSSATGLGNFFVRNSSAIYPQFIRIIRNLSANYPHYPQFVRNLSALSAMCPHCIRIQPMRLARQQTTSVCNMCKQKHLLSAVCTQVYDRHCLG